MNFRYLPHAAKVQLLDTAGETVGFLDNVYPEPTEAQVVELVDLGKVRFVAKLCEFPEGAEFLYCGYNYIKGTESGSWFLCARKGQEGQPNSALRIVWSALVEGVES